MIIDMIAIVATILLTVIYFICMVPELTIKENIKRNYRSESKASIVAWVKAVALFVMTLGLADFVCYGWCLIFSYLF